MALSQQERSGVSIKTTTFHVTFLGGNKVMYHYKSLCLVAKKLLEQG